MGKWLWVWVCGRVLGKGWWEWVGVGVGVGYRDGTGLVGASAGAVDVSRTGNRFLAALAALILANEDAKVERRIR